MDQIGIATEQYLRDELAKAVTKNEQLEKALEISREQARSNARQINATTEAMQEWTMEEFTNGQLTESQAEEISEICGFELTKEVEAEVTVVYSITLQVPAGEDAESMINDIDFESISYNSDNISYVTASVDRIEI